MNKERKTKFSIKLKMKDTIALKKVYVSKEKVCLSIV